ncbi:MAG: hypothetical protein Q8M40_05495 [Legionella sp.]|nr:hypothetical protein [Legionella sp.]
MTQFTHQQLINLTNPYEELITNESLIENQNTINQLPIDSKYELATQIVLQCPTSKLSDLHHSIESLRTPINDNATDFYSILNQAFVIKCHIIALYNPENTKAPLMFAELDNFLEEFQGLVETLLTENESSLARNLVRHLNKEVFQLNDNKQNEVVQEYNEKAKSLFPNNTLHEKISNAFILRSEIEQHLLGNRPGDFFLSERFNLNNCLDNALFFIPFIDNPELNLATKIAFTTRLEDRPKITQHVTGLFKGGKLEYELSQAFALCDRMNQFSLTDTNDIENNENDIMDYGIKLCLLDCDTLFTMREKMDQSYNVNNKEWREKYTRMLDLIIQVKTQLLGQNPDSFFDEAFPTDLCNEFPYLLDELLKNNIKTIGINLCHANAENLSAISKKMAHVKTSALSQSSCRQELNEMIGLIAQIKRQLLGEKPESFFENTFPGDQCIKFPYILEQLIKDNIGEIGPKLSTNNPETYSSIIKKLEPLNANAQVPSKYIKKLTKEFTEALDFINKIDIYLLSDKPELFFHNDHFDADECNKYSLILKDVLDKNREAIGQKISLSNAFSDINKKLGFINSKFLAQDNSIDKLREEIEESIIYRNEVKNKLTDSPKLFFTVNFNSDDCNRFHYILHELIKNDSETIGLELSKCSLETRGQISKNLERIRFTAHDKTNPLIKIAQVMNNPQSINEGIDHGSKVNKYASNPNGFYPSKLKVIKEKRDHSHTSTESHKSMHNIQ